MKEDGKFHKTFASDFIFFCSRTMRFDLSTFSNSFTPFSTLEGQNQVPGQKLKIWGNFCAESMLNKCAKFHGGSRSGLNVQFKLASAIEISETAGFVSSFVWKPYTSEQLWWHIWPTFPLKFIMQFSQRMPLIFFYSMMQESQKWPKTQINGGVLH